MWYYNQCTILFIVNCHPKRWFCPKIADMHGPLCSLYCSLDTETLPETAQQHALSESRRIFWYFYCEKNDSEFKTPEKAPKQSILRIWYIFWWSKKLLGQKFCLECIPHYNKNFWNCNSPILRVINMATAIFSTFN